MSTWRMARWFASRQITVLGFALVPIVIAVIATMCHPSADKPQPPQGLATHTGTTLADPPPNGSTHPLEIRFPDPQAVEMSPGLAGEACAGHGFKLSVMANQANCQVRVGSILLGVAPIFKKDAPIGNCDINIVCPSGRRWQQKRKLAPGGEDKILILKDSDWSN